MNSLDKFLLIDHYIKRNLGCDIDIFPLHSLHFGDYSGWNRRVNGCFYYSDDRSVKHQIDLYIENLERDIDDVICCLMHEVGHLLCYEEIGDDHTESDAWDLAISCFPEDLIPPGIHEFMEEALTYYDTL